MVNNPRTFGIDPGGGHPERALALGYAPAAGREGVLAVFALDATLAKLALGTRDPMVAQLRLTWWYEVLMALHAAPAPAQPILQVLTEAGADGAALAATEVGWEQLLGETDDAALMTFATARAGVFREAGRLAGAADNVADAGAGWALADLAGITADPAVASRSRALAAPLLARAAGQRWSSAGRFLGALVHVARADLAGERPVGAPARVARLAWHRLTGR